MVGGLDMSKDGHLPPGVEYHDLPGNRPEDTLWEELCDWICELTNIEPFEIKIAINGYIKMRDAVKAITADGEQLERHMTNMRMKDLEDQIKSLGGNVEY
jgi:hypothetical protein